MQPLPVQTSGRSTLSLRQNRRGGSKGNMISTVQLKIQSTARSRSVAERCICGLAVNTAAEPHHLTEIYDVYGWLYRKGRQRVQGFFYASIFERKERRAGPAFPTLSLLEPSRQLRLDGCPRHPPRGVSDGLALQSCCCLPQAYHSLDTASVSVPALRLAFRGSHGLGRLFW